MTKIRTMHLTAHQAIELEHRGFILKLKDFGLMLWDVYADDSYKEPTHEKESKDL